MYSADDLVAEIQSQFLEMEKAGNGVPKTWLIQSILSAHQGIEGDDREFAVYSCYACVTKGVEAFFNKIHRQETETEHQKTIEGFEHVRPRYIIERNDERVATRIGDMTTEEIRAKALQLRSMAAGAIAHARELERLADMRDNEQEGLSV
jgi:hypothetical protein